MYIESAEIQNFGNIEATAAKFAPLTIIRGANHQGKSRIANAIQLAMVGRCKGTDAQGRGAGDKIRKGADRASIGLVLRGKNGVTMPFGVSYAPNRQVTTTNPPGFTKWLTENNDRLACAFDSEYFIRQSPEEQKKILASLVLPTRFDFPEDKRKLVQEALGVTPDWSGNPVQLIDTIYQASYDARKEAKAALKAVHIPKLPEKPAHTVEQIKDKLAELREKAGKLSKPAVAQTAAVELGQLQERLRQAQDTLRNLEADANDLRTSINEADAEVLATVDYTRYKRVADHRSEIDCIDEEINEIVLQIEQFNTLQAMFRDLLRDEDGNQLEHPECPTCRQTISEAFVNARIDDARKEVATLGQRQRDLLKKQLDLGDVAEAEKIIAAHNRAQENKSAFQANLSGTVSRIATTKEAIRNIQAQIAQVKPDPQPAQQDTTELDALNQKIARIEGELTPAITYEAAVKQIEDAVKKQRELTAKVEALETLCKYFGKDGVKAALINDNIDGFQASVNAVLDMWGYKARLSIEPYSFEVKLPTGAILPLKELSGSEELMFAAALQTAIACHSGIRAVVIDKADTFIDEERNRLFFGVNSLLANKTLEQAIIMVADNRTQAPPKEGVAYYAAQAGKLVRL